MKKVTICIPIYNGEKYLEKTLNSLINQTYKNIEILIGDNGSVDSTEEIVKKYQESDKRISYIKNEQNLGYSGNCNKLVSISKGDYIAIFHADDIYDSQIIEKEVKALEENLDLVGVFTFGNMINEADEIIGEILNRKVFKKREEITKLNLKEYLSEVLEIGNFLICPTGMVRRNIYQKTEYSSTVKLVEDMDMWINLLKQGNLGIINEKLINYRVHAQQASSFFREENFESLPLDILLLESYINNDKKISEMGLESKLNLRKTKAYLSFAYRLLKLDRYEDFIMSLNKSKKIKRLNVFSKHGLFQNFLWNKKAFKIINKIIK